MKWQIENKILLLAAVNMTNRFAGITPGLEYYKMSPEQEKQMKEMLAEKIKQENGIVIPGPEKTRN